MCGFSSPIPSKIFPQNSRHFSPKKIIPFPNLTVNICNYFLLPCVGYLSNSPSEFFLELMEFVTTLVEHGTPPYQALQTNLPNLFGPVFGVHDHSVSCQLLEYGSLAVCSQHK